MHAGGLEVAVEGEEGHEVPLNGGVNVHLPRASRRARLHAELVAGFGGFGGATGRKSWLLKASVRKSTKGLGEARCCFDVTGLLGISQA